MKEMLDKLTEELKDATRVAFMGIGEEKMRDDAVGPYIISKLLDFSNDKFLFVNAGVDPMARMYDIINFKPSHFVLIDSCSLNADPGTVAILRRDDMADVIPISSHTVPVHIVVDLIVKDVPGIKTFMIGIVPESFEGFTTLEMFGNGKYSVDDISENEDLPFWDIHLTDTVQKVADGVVELIKTIMQKL